MRRSIFRLVLPVLLIAPTVSAWAQDGSLDPAFGGGFVFADAFSQYGAAQAAAAVADGVLLVGRDSAEAIVLKLRRDGTRDESFGVKGRRAVKIGGQAVSWNAIAVLDDGSFLTAGAAVGSGPTVSALTARFTPSGALDPTYGDGGLRLLPELGESAGVAVLPTTDGRHLVVGGRWRATTGNAPPPPPGSGFELIPAPLQTTIARLDASGALDPDYGDNGIAVLGLDGQFVAATDAVLDDEGGLVIAGEVGTPGSPFFGDWFAARFDAAGQFDADFGVPQIDFGGSLEFGTTVAVDGADRVLVAGARATQFANTLAFARFLPSGAPDPTFGEAGISDFPDPAVGFFVLANDLAVQPDGRILFVGSRSDSFLTSDVLLGRLLPDGSLDPSFADTGIRSLNLQSGDLAFAVVPDTDGGYFAAGAATTNDYRSSIPFALRLNGPVTTDIDAGPPDAFAVSGITPNPVGTRGRLAFSVAAPSVVRMDIVDMLGRTVQSTETRYEAGEHTLTLDLGAVAAGVYVAVLRTKAGVATQRFTVTR